MDSPVKRNVTMPDKSQTPDHPANRSATDCSGSREWERWRDAGELFGRVKMGLGFGDVSLCENTDNLRGFSIQWWFNARGKRWSQKWCFDDRDIEMRGGPERMANDLVEMFKENARSKVGADFE